MILKLIYSMLIFTYVTAKYIPRFNMDLDHEEHELLKSVYDTPSYDHDEEDEHEDESGLVNLHLTCRLVTTLPIPPTNIVESYQINENEQQLNNTNIKENGEVISVRITSSVAVERGRKARPIHPISNVQTEETITLNPTHVAASENIIVTDLPPNLSGANLEFIKQLNAKKHKTTTSPELPINEPFNKFINNDTFKGDYTQQEDEYSDVPLARSIAYYPKELANYDQTLNKPKSKVTAVSFNIVHNPPTNENIQIDQHFNEPSKTFSQPAKIYSEPAKFYSEPAKIYSEPAKVYSEPAKIYSEPAKIYSEPAKFYSQPASLHLDLNPFENVLANQGANNVTDTEKIVEAAKSESTTEHNKVGYVVEGKEFKKYRVEERTADGFIVGEYGVVRNEDGALRGVRYTADGEASPSLIHDGLMRFLGL